MGKSNKKANVEVAAAPVSVPRTKEAKKGKKGAEEAPEKRSSSKRQKIEAEQVGQNKKKVKKLKKALIEPQGEKKDEARCSNFEEEVAATPIAVQQTKAATKGKRSAEEAPENQASSKNQRIEVEQPGQNKKRVKRLKKTLIESPGKKKDETSRLDFEVEKSSAPKSKLVSAAAAAKKQELNESSSGSDSDEEDGKPVKFKPNSAITVSRKKADSSDSSSESDFGEEVKRKTFSIPKAAAGASKKKPESSDSSSDSDSELENKKTDNKRQDSFLDDAKNKEISQISEKEPESSANRDEVSGIKRLFVGNLPSEVIKDDLLEFFKKAGEVTEVRLAANDDGSFRGFGHVEFVTEADAQKARRMNGQLLLGRPLIVDLAREIGLHKSHDGKENGCYRVGVQDSVHSVFVKGFGKSLEEDQIRKSLMEHFGSCGEIIRLSIPQDNKTRRTKGFAYVMFNDQAAASKALELNGTELRGHTLTVEQPTPKSGHRDGGAYSGGRGSGGRSAGQGGGRDGGGRGRGRGGRAPGAPYNKSAITASKGTKEVH